MIERVKNAGIVGMGGATFPTHVKITSGIGKVSTVIINGAECEPYITGDHRTMLERPEEIIGGAKFLAKMFGVDKVIHRRGGQQAKRHRRHEQGHRGREGPRGGGAPALPLPPGR